MGGVGTRGGLAEEVRHEKNVVCGRRGSLSPRGPPSPGPLE